MNTNDGDNGMKKAIISGADGFVGNAVANYLVKQGIEVLALSRKKLSADKTASSPIQWIPFELFDARQLLRHITPKSCDTFFHFAWASTAGSGRSDVALQLKNVQSTIDCLRVAQKLGCKRFVLSGSIMEQETIAAAYEPGNKPGMAYIYGGAKLAEHVMCASVATDIGIDLICPKIINAYGPGELSARMINTTLKKCLNGESPRFTAATQNYDFVYIDDIARAFYLIAQKGKSFTEYVIGSSTARPLKKFLLEMKAAVAPDLDFVFGDVPFTGIDLPLSTFDCSVTERDTGFRAEISFAEGTKKTLEWLRKHSTT
jgi:nucleoside-diphosphate-sugar epimerase